MPSRLSARLISRPPSRLPSRAAFAAALRALAARRDARLLAVGVTVAAVVAGLLAAGDHNVYPTTRIPLESGQAWVTSEQIGALTLVDGVVGQTVTNVTVARRAGDALQAGQSGSTGFALDRSAGVVTRIDGAGLEPRAAAQPLSGSGQEVSLFAGSRLVYAVDGAHSQVSVYDAATLRRRGSPVPYGVGRSDYTAVVDGADRLWVLDGGTGRLTRFDGTSRHRRPRTFAPGTTTLSLADGHPVVTDGATGTAYLLGPDGGTRSTLPLRLTAADGIEVGGASTQDALLVTVGSRGTYLTCPFALGACDRPIEVGFGEDTLGQAVAAAGRVFIPDFTTGGAWIVDPTGSSAARRVTLLGHAARFDLFERNGLVFFNDPRSNRAGTVAIDGKVREIAKYASAAPSAPPSAAPTPAAPNSPTGEPDSPPSGTPPASAATPGDTATVRPTGTTGPVAPSSGSTAPPGSTGTPSGSPTATKGPRPSGSPTPTAGGSPSPSPTPTGSTTVNCGDTLTRNTVLTADLHCAGNALVIGADHVTLDLGGHTISGNGTGTGIALRESGVPVAHTVVTNGTLARFATGLSVGPDGATDTAVNMTVFQDDGTDDATAAIDLGGATVNDLRVTQVTSHQDSGNFFLSTGPMSGTLDLTGSTITGGGFQLLEPADVTVALLLTDDSFDHAAVRLENVEGATVTKDAFASSPVWDMCFHSGSNTFRDNQFTGPVYALTIEGMAGETISGNVFSGNLVGVYMTLGDGDTGNAITGNTFTGDTNAGIWVDDSGSAPLRVDVTGNTVTESGHSPGGRTDGGGFPVQGGIHLYAPAGGLVVSDNHTGRNSGYGIWSRPGTATGTGNVSTGDEDGCEPVDLCTYG